MADHHVEPENVPNAATHVQQPDIQLRSSTTIFQELLTTMRSNWREWGLNDFLHRAKEKEPCDGSHTSCTPVPDSPSCRECQEQNKTCPRELDLITSLFPPWASDLISGLYHGLSAEEELRSLKEKLRAERALRQSAETRAGRGVALLQAVREELLITSQLLKDDNEDAARAHMKTSQRIRVLEEEVSFLQERYQTERDRYEQCANELKVETRALERKLSSQERVVSLVQRNLRAADDRFTFSPLTFAADFKAFMRLHKERSSRALDSVAHDNTASPPDLKSSKGLLLSRLDNAEEGPSVPRRWKRARTRSTRVHIDAAI